MSITSEHGSRLYQLLPAIYRERDNGDLEKYLDACGGLLDAIQHTLEQLHADSFPDTPPDGLACQDWVLPYFARLLDVRLVSHEAKGRREEIARAVAWRQGKGTPWVVEEIAEAVGDVEVEIAEGWQRVATTARLNMPLLPARDFGVSPEPDMSIPSEAARHPGLAALTVDLRHPSRAVLHPAACLGGRDWVQGNPQGVPCFPGSYDDATRRTVDFRTPDWRHGHHHPRTLLLYAEPQPGFFPVDITEIKWVDRAKPEYQALVEIAEDAASYRIRNRSSQAIRFTGPATLSQHKDYHIEGFAFSATVNCQHGRLFLNRVAAPRVVAQFHGPAVPALSARDCLFRDVSTATGLMRLEYCTVLRKTVCEWIEASDCIFAGKVQKDHPTQEKPPQAGCIRYSRLSKTAMGAVAVFHCSTAKALFFASHYGDRSCGVLHPASLAEIRHGAEDGGEMGAFHSRSYVLQWEAMVSKLQDFLPVGIEAVVIPAASLACPAPLKK
ncbi:MAG: phage tail protein [Sulfurimicrobium sp.]|nr:phage tail protein [Sulfurimicrobium sp.]